MPTQSSLLDIRPGSRKPLWIDVLECAGQSLTASDASLVDYYSEVATSWSFYLSLLSWWQFKRYFYRSGTSVKCKSRPAVVVLHPVGRFSTASAPAQWRDACFWTLLAHCNHFPVGEHSLQFCGEIFPSLDALQDSNVIPDEKLHELTAFFVMASPEQRAAKQVCSCPPHVRKNWLLGLARRQRQEERKLEHAAATAPLSEVQFVFEEDAFQWQSKLFADMDPAEQEDAKNHWKQAAADYLDQQAESEVDENQRDQSLTVACHKKMYEAIGRFRWSVRELHDATVLSGLALPSQLDPLSYFVVLLRQ